MKKILLSIFVLLVLVLAACSINTYLPCEECNDTVIFNDSFEFVNDTNGIVDEDQDNVVVDNESEEAETEEEVPEDEPEEVPGEDELVLATITATEGDTVSLAEFQAEDPDGDRIIYTYSEPFDEDGEWITAEGDAGTYYVDIMASDGVLSTTEQIKIVVVLGNQAPVIDCLSKVTVREGDLIDLDCEISDPEGEEVTYEITGFMDSMTYQSDFADQGEYLVTITASDGDKTSTKEIEVVIDNANRAPVVEELEPIEAVEGDVITLEFDITDADGDDVEITYPLLFDEDGVWETEKGDAGEYELTASFSDGYDIVDLDIEITVEELNLPPTLETIDDIEVDEGETVTIEVFASDEEDDDLEITISGWMDDFTYTTNYDDAGEHTVLVSVTDGIHTVSQEVEVTVNNVNRPPTFVVN